MPHFRAHFPESGEDWIELRRDLGLSRAEVARRAALDPATVWKLEHDRDVAESTRRLVASVLGLRVFPAVEEPTAA